MSHPEVDPSVAQHLARLAPDQQAAATAPPGPILCVAPAGSGKTATLVARIAWLITGPSRADPATICALTFNRRAADELRARLERALESPGVAGELPRVRTFHALGREILRESGIDVSGLVDRAAHLRSLFPDAPDTALRRMDDAFGRLKLDLRLAPDALARIAREATGPERRTTRAKRNAPSPTDLRTVGAFLAYQASLRDRGALDFDDLVVRALELLIREAEPLRLWRRRCAHLLVDEVQDLDRSQLDLAVLLAGEERRIFLVGDDDQTIYAWRLADVRRVIGLAAQLPGLRRFDLTVNYRCPRPVVERAVRLVAHNRERFRKRIAPRAGATGSLRLAPLPTDDVTRARRILGRWRQEGLAADAGARWAVLARTNTELAPYGAVALELGIPFSAEEHGLLLDVPSVDERLDAAEAAAGLEADPLVAMARLHQRDAAASALLAWAAPYPTIGALRTAIATARQRLTMLHRDDAALVLATVHGTKGLEFDHVAVVGLDEGRFPSRRSLEESENPKRALEEERRLAYVAWTRAKRTLTLVYDPGAPSRFLREAFGEQELSPGSGSSAGTVS